MILPHSRAHEEAVLGAVLLADEAWPHAAAILIAADFWLPAHRWIFISLTELAACGSSLDAVSVAEQLEKHDRYGDCGGLECLAKLALQTASTTPSTVIAHALRVAELARIRRIREAAERVAAGDNSALAELMALAA